MKRILETPFCFAAACWFALVALFVFVVFWVEEKLAWREDM